MKIPIIILILGLIVLAGCSDLNNNVSDTQSSTISEKQEYSGPSKLVIGKKIDINKNIKAGNFEITLNKYLVDPKWQIYEDSDETESVAYFYFTIKNIGTKEEQFFPQDIALITNSDRQLSETFDSTLRMKTFYSGVKEEMDLYFEALQKDEKPKTLKFKIGDFSKYSIYEYNLNSNQVSVSDFVRCDDGEYRKSEEECKSAKSESNKCEDGTPDETCSKDKPKYCSYGQLSDNADKCGCPTGYEKDNLYGCNKINTAEPIGFDSTYCSKSESLLKCSFNLVDGSGKQVKSDGKYEFRVIDVFGDNLYQKSQSVGIDDYTGYSDKVEFVVPLTEIKNNLMEKTEISFKFTTKSGKELKSTDSVYLTAYSDSEKTTILQTRYNQNANDDKETVTQGDFKVSVIKRGIYEDVSSYDIKKYMRYDIEIENTANEKVAFVSKPLITMDGIEYEDSYKTTLESGMNFYEAKQKKTSYILFEGDKLPNLPLKNKYTLRIGTDYSGIGDFAGMTYTYNNEYKLELKD